VTELPDSRVSRSEFWDQAYQEGRTGWDIGGPSPSFEDLLRDTNAPAPGRLAVIGAGKGNDALFFARHGFSVTGFDFAPLAVEEARNAARDAGIEARFVQADIFALPAEYDNAFDYLVEHACFCAIDPARRGEYVEAASKLLRPGGQLIGVFFAHDRSGGPPFTTDDAELRRLFGGVFQIEHLAPALRSVERRQGQELFGRFRRL
jgi:SAM-dependent methyltransferase